jgi:hypothetical protein
LGERHRERPIGKNSNCADYRIADAIIKGLAGLARRCLVIMLGVAATLPAVGGVCAGQDPPSRGTTGLPDAPQPQIPVQAADTKNAPCPAPKSSSSTGAADATAGGASTSLDPSGVAPQSSPCKMTWGRRYERFVDGPAPGHLSPKDKAWLAARGFLDPFNSITILGNAAISVGSDSHSPYGPGMPGFGRYVGVSYTQDLIGEFFGTFLICSLAHQDPHYHRMPKSKIPRRIEHAIVQVVWTRSDNGNGMLNYENLVGFAIGDELSNLFVPGRQTNLPASAARYATGIATAPIDNFVTEFLPDVASHIHVEVVIIQRIINQVAKTEGGGEP